MRTSSDALNELLMRLPANELEAVAQQIAERAFAAGVWMEVDGARQPLRITFRPRVIDIQARAYVHSVCWRLRMALRRLSGLIADDPEVAVMLPLEEEEREWLRALRPRNAAPGAPGAERLFCRFDAIARLDTPSWPRQMRLVEVNVVGVGGIRYAGTLDRIAREILAPRIERYDSELTLETPTDPRRLLLEELLAQARSAGLERPPVIALVDDKSLYEHGGECAQLAAHYSALGYDARYLDPDEVTDEIDVVYRTLDIAELIEFEREGRDLSGLRRAFAAGRVVPTAGGDLEHKSVFEVLTSPALASRFSQPMREAARAHVLWTRLVSARTVDDVDGRQVDLLDYVRRAREQLVLKPNRGYGGDRVLLGPFTDASTWEAALNEAAAAPGTWVVQALCEPNRERFPIIEPDGRVELRELYTTSGFFVGASDLAVFGRTGQTPVVNLATGGAISPFLVHVG